MLRISDAANLGLHAMLHLARAPGEATHSVAEIAAETEVSEAHLSKVMQRLCRAGLVASRRGPGGGFVLGAPAADITLLDIYQAIDGPLPPADRCLLGRQSCLYGECIFGELLGRLDCEIREFLATRRLSDFARTEASGSRARQTKKKERLK